MHATAKVHAMHNEEWSGSRVAAVLALLKDAGYPQSKMGRLAGVDRSTVNRWSRGEIRPGHDPVRKLSAAVWRDHPDIARELVEASGYMWATPEEAELPPPELDDDAELMERLRSAYRNDPDKVRAAFEAVKWAESLPTGQRAAGEESTSERHAG